MTTDQRLKEIEEKYKGWLSVTEPDLEFIFSVLKRQRLALDVAMETVVRLRDETGSLTVHAVVDDTLAEISRILEGG